MSFMFRPEELLDTMEPPGNAVHDDAPRTWQQLCRSLGNHFSEWRRMILGGGPQHWVAWCSIGYATETRVPSKGFARSG
jgi:hypothetical protein